MSTVKGFKGFNSRNDIWNAGAAAADTGGGMEMEPLKYCQRVQRLEFTRPHE